MAQTSEEFYTAWTWLEGHPAFEDEIGTSYFVYHLQIDYQKVIPGTHKVDQDHPERNTHIEVWLEHGYYLTDKERTQGYSDEFAKGECCHDIKLDCCGNTFEEAIMTLHAKVKEQYGEYDAPRWVERKAEFLARKKVWWKEGKGDELVERLMGPGEKIEWD